MKRAVRTVLRLIAAGLMLFGGLELGLEFLRRNLPETRISLWRCLIGALLLVLGGTLFAASARLAEQWTDDLDE
jgi:hypothetical protein